MKNPNLTTKSERINLTLSEYTVRQIDSYAETLNMPRSNVIETMLMIFIKYAAHERQERRVRK